MNKCWQENFFWWCTQNDPKHICLTYFLSYWRQKSSSVYPNQKNLSLDYLYFQTKIHQCCNSIQQCTKLYFFFVFSFIYWVKACKCEKREHWNILLSAQSLLSHIILLPGKRFPGGWRQRTLHRNIAICKKSLQAW